MKATTFEMENILNGIYGQLGTEEEKFNEL